MESRCRKVKLTQSVVDKAEPEASRYTVADTVLPGFWLVVEPTGRKTFKLRYRVGGGRSATVREPMIGDASAIKCAMARTIAEDWLADVAKGEDPGGDRLARRKGATMADLFAAFLSDHAEKVKKASSVSNDRRLIETKLGPALGKRKVAEVTQGEVAKLHSAMSKTPYEANRCLALLSKAFNLAEVWG